jgi:hypothetical protein
MNYDPNIKDPNWDVISCDTRKEEVRTGIGRALNEYKGWRVTTRYAERGNNIYYQLHRPDGAWSQHDSDFETEEEAWKSSGLYGWTEDYGSREEVFALLDEIPMPLTMKWTCVRNAKYDEAHYFYIYDMNDQLIGYSGSQPNEVAAVTVAWLYWKKRVDTDEAMKRYWRTFNESQGTEWQSAFSGFISPVVDESEDETP